MSRTAQDVLEFDKLRELLRLRTTCAPGRRAVDALGFSVDRAALEAAFAQIREAREWLRAERELGFGGLADPETWLGADRRSGHGTRAGAIARRCHTAGHGGLAASAISRRRREVSAARGARGFARGFSRYAGGDSTRDSAERRDQRRCVAGAAAHSSQHRADARLDPEDAEADFALAQCRSRRRLRHAAQRSLRDSRARRTSAQRAGRGARRQRHRADRFSRAARDRRDQQSTRAACRRRSR